MKNLLIYIYKWKHVYTKAISSTNQEDELFICEIRLQQWAYKTNNVKLGCVRSWVLFQIINFPATMILKQPKTRYLLSPKNGKLFHKLHRILQKKHGSTNTNKTCVYNAKVKGYNVWRRMKLTGPYVISPHVGGSTSYLQSLLKPYLVKEMKDNRNWAHSKMHTNVGTGGEPWDRTHPWQLGIPSSRNVIVSATATCGFVSFEGRGKNALRKVPGYLKGTPNSLRYLGSSLFHPTLTDNDANVHLIFIFTRWCLDPS